uniref:Uncharacterized protein n=1 Tax=uncultured marine virus TaxID=186617 RepID=A0A0F7L583_9VIRU|nr:hypothetical protein [uncultured marine virus]
MFRERHDSATERHDDTSEGIVYRVQAHSFILITAPRRRGRHEATPSPVGPVRSRSTGTARPRHTRPRPGRRAAPRDGNWPLPTNHPPDPSRLFRSPRPRLFSRVGTCRVSR